MSSSISYNTEIYKKKKRKRNKYFRKYFLNTLKYFKEKAVYLVVIISYLSFIEIYSDVNITLRVICCKKKKKKNSSNLKN